MNRNLTLVVVADGGIARFFTWPKGGAHLAEHDTLRMVAPPSEGERGAAPRVQDSMGHHRHSIERRLTAHEAAEEKFLLEIARQAETLMTRFAAKSLVLCAPPKALGSLRAALGKAGKDYELITVAKDLTKETPGQIDRRVRGLGASSQT